MAYPKSPIEIEMKDFARHGAGTNNHGQETGQLSEAILFLASLLFYIQENRFSIQMAGEHIRKLKKLSGQKTATPSANQWAGFFIYLDNKNLLTDENLVKLKSIIIHSNTLSQPVSDIVKCLHEQQQDNLATNFKTAETISIISLPEHPKLEETNSALPQFRDVNSGNEQDFHAFVANPRLFDNDSVDTESVELRSNLENQATKKKNTLDSAPKRPTQQIINKAAKIADTLIESQAFGKLRYFSTYIRLLMSNTATTYHLLDTLAKAADGLSLYRMHDFYNPTHYDSQSLANYDIDTYLAQAKTDPIFKAALELAQNHEREALQTAIYQKSLEFTGPFARTRINEQDAVTTFLNDYPKKDNNPKNPINWQKVDDSGETRRSVIKRMTSGL